MFKYLDYLKCGKTEVKLVRIGIPIIISNPTFICNAECDKTPCKLSLFVKTEDSNYLFVTKLPEYCNNYIRFGDGAICQCEVRNYNAVKYGELRKNSFPNS
ncbi:MAG: hypothetical protein KDC90_19525 [Ignavibacteriae bacterium]|nr:hypothetical protein [Ignavibacteriota bacterium]